MDLTTPEVIANSQALIEVMGRWPRFHDAYLLQAERKGDSLHVVVHVFEMTAEVDAAGYFVLAKHHLVELELLRVVTGGPPHDYDGDILDSITARKSAAGVLVAFESVVDPTLDWHAVCGEARISGVTPCDLRGHVIQQ